MTRVLDNAWIRKFYYECALAVLSYQHIMTSNVSVNNSMVFLFIKEALVHSSLHAYMCVQMFTFNFLPRTKLLLQYDLRLKKIYIHVIDYYQED